MYLRISGTGEVTAEHAVGPLDRSLMQSLRTEHLHAHYLAANLTLITGATRGWGANPVATGLLKQAGIHRAVSGPAALLSCAGERILDQVTEDALDALADVSALHKTTSPATPPTSAGLHARGTD